MGGISVILRRPPYGSVDAAEAIRHVLGGLTEEMEVKLILVDSGVTVAKKGQDTSDTEYSNIETGIRDCIEMGAEVYADKGSMREYHLENNEIVEGVIIANGSEIAGIIKETDTTIIF